uniref:Uncharacterized protein n=1 Tax=Haptolina ericina TaxID=156174 RepID=A0A7S3AM53_9EUKA
MDFFNYEVERNFTGNDSLGLQEMEDAERSGRDLLSSQDFDASNAAAARCLRAADWVVVEAATRDSPRFILGADGDGRRGMAFYWDGSQWVLLRNLALPRATLLLGEIVTEYHGGRSCVEGCIHVFDAAVIAGDDVRRQPYAERRRRLGMLVDAMERDDEIQRQMGLPNPMVPMRLKPVATLGEIASVLEAQEAREEAPSGPQWRGEGLLMFPGHNSVLLPLEVSHGSAPADWTGPHRSRSTGMDYWHNKRTNKAVWRHERKSKPISFRSCVAILLRWYSSAGTIPKDELCRLAAAVAAADQKPR